jgi:alpha-tubulin suppressor-like RCC1 family protein
LTVSGWVVSAAASAATAAATPTATPAAVESYPIPTPAAARQAADGAIASKEISTCALTAAGGVKCWGDNRNGQLGDGTRVDSLIAVDVAGLSNGAAAVTVGDAHACALTAAGGIVCWGMNFDGQLGDGTTTDNFTPVRVSGLSGGMAAVKAGKWHTCALTAAGGVMCWGLNHRGLCGDGTTMDRRTPVDVVGLSGGVAALAAGRQHACALMENGGIKCWGDNRNGQLGDGTTTDRHVPVDVKGSPDGYVAVVAGDYHTCALTREGGVECWGDDAFGQLGHGEGCGSFRKEPVGVSGLASGVSGLALGVNHTCALTDAGEVKCWGRNYSGQLGNGKSTGIEDGVCTPVDVVGLPGGVTALAAGWGHTCAVMQNGGIMCWGLNRYATLGDGTRTDRLTPVSVIGFIVG